jgi:hypothetical protein
MNLVDDELLLKVFKRVRITSTCGFKSEMQGSKENCFNSICCGKPVK